MLWVFDVVGCVSDSFNAVGGTTYTIDVALGTLQVRPTHGLQLQLRLRVPHCSCKLRAAAAIENPPLQL